MPASINWGTGAWPWASPWHTDHVRNQWLHMPTGFRCAASFRETHRDQLFHEWMHTQERARIERSTACRPSIGRNDVYVSALNEAWAAVPPPREETPSPTPAAHVKRGEELKAMRKHLQDSLATVDKLLAEHARMKP